MTIKFISKKANKLSLSKRSLVHGVGINDADYVVRPKINGKYIFCPYYVVWAHMIERCYSEDHLLRYPSYKECIVCDDWLKFGTFRAWMEKQDWQGKQLDKDILIIGNKTYSPETCFFVTNHVNSLFCVHQSSKGRNAQGVHFNKEDGKFRAACKVSGKNKYLGSFDTEKKASNVYRKAKYNEIIRVANLQPEVVKNALYRHAELYGGASWQVM